MRHPSQKSPVKSLHDRTYQGLVEALVERRTEAGLSQQAVADRLGWNQSIIAKIETAQRRIDLIELIRLSAVVGFDVVKLVREIRSDMIADGEI